MRGGLRSGAMADVDEGGQAVLAAGAFTPWMVEIQSAIRGERGSDVPCDGCTACCTSSQFIHIEPDEGRTLSRIPAALLFPAPGLPRGHRLMGYDENGHCPMLIDGACSIYADRPRTCRTYDCRVFPAADIDIENDKPLIGARAKRWKFSHPTSADVAQHEAVRAAARFIDEHAELLPGRSVPTTATQRAVLAVEIHNAFLDEDDVSGLASAVDHPEPEVVVAELTRVTQAHRDGVPGSRVRRHSR